MKTMIPPNPLKNLIEEKGTLCLSIILPTNRYVGFRMLNSGVLKKGFKQASQLLENRKYPEDKKKILQHKLKDVFRNIPPGKLKDGIGLFLSEKISETVIFPFPVEEKIVMDQSFEIRDLITLEDYFAPFYVLSLSKKIVHLYSIRGDILSEVKDNNFPSEFIDDYEYSKPGPGSAKYPSPKSFERDKSNLEEMRQISFLKKTDEALQNYVNSSIPFMVYAPKEIISNFKNITQNSSFLMGSIPGQIIKTNTPKLIQQCRKVFKTSKEIECQNILKRLEEEFGNKMVAAGIENVWAEVHRGNNLILIVEKNYRERVYFEKNKIHMSPPVRDYNIAVDAVDDLIELNYKKGGKILFTEDQTLKNFNHIALLLRYKNEFIRKPHPV